MRSSLLFAIVVCITCAACKKQQQAPRQYVPGMLLVGLKGKTPMESAFALANKYNLTIQQILGYTYITPYPADSISSLTAYLNTKKYIDTFGWKVTVEKNVFGSIWVLANYRYMDAAAQSDWIKTKGQLQLTEDIPASTIADSLKDMTLLVPIGQEQALLNVIQQDPSVTWVQLNYIEHVQL